MVGCNQLERDHTESNCWIVCASARVIYKWLAASSGREKRCWWSANVFHSIRLRNKASRVRCATLREINSFYLRRADKKDLRLMIWFRRLISLIHIALASAPLTSRRTEAKGHSHPSRNISLLLRERRWNEIWMDTCSRLFKRTVSKAPEMFMRSAFLAGVSLRNKHKTALRSERCWSTQHTSIFD